MTKPDLPTYSMKVRWNNRMEKNHAICGAFRRKYNVDRIRYDDSIEQTAKEFFVQVSTVVKVVNGEPEGTYLSLKFTDDEMA